MFKGTPGPLADRHLDADEKHTVLEATARYYQRLFEGALGRKRDDRNFTRPIIGAWERERRRREKAVEIGWAMLDTPVHIGTAAFSGLLMTDATCGAAWTWNGFANGGGWGLEEVGRGGRGFALAMAMIPAGRIENVADDAARVGMRTGRPLARATEGSLAARTTPGQYDGVRALSQTLRDAGVPRADRLDVINSFRQGSISVRQATGNENVIRFFGGEANQLGRFVTPNFPQGDARRLLALPPNNSATGLIQFNLRPGATFFEGTVAPNFGRPGGGVQYFVPNLNNLVVP